MRNLALAIALEAAELNELFLWKNQEQSEWADRDKIAEELADVTIYALLLANRNDLSVSDIVLEKIQKNAEKYPVSKAKGKATKYTNL